MLGHRGRKVGGGGNWEIGIDVYTLLILCIIWITPENILHGPGNSSQCYVVISMGRKSKKEGIRTHTADSLCCTAELNTTVVKQLYSNKN